MFSLLLDFLAVLCLLVWWLRSAGRELVLLDEDEEEEVVVQSRPVRCCTLWGARRRKGGREGGMEGRSQVEVVVCIVYVPSHGWEMQHTIAASQQAREHFVLVCT